MRRHSRLRDRTPASQEAHRQVKIARKRIDILTVGIAKLVENIWDREELHEVLHFIETDLFLAMEALESAEKRYEATRKKPARAKKGKAA